MDMWWLVGVVLDSEQVRMDLQLYKVDSSNYLVDFRNVGYYRTPPDQKGFARLPNPPPPTTTTTTSSLATPQTAGTGTKEEQTQEVTSPFLFLDCACRSVHPSCSAFASLFASLVCAPRETDD